MDPKLKELSLLVIYMSGWEEDSPTEPGGKEFRAWRGYRLEILNQLERENMICQSSGSLTLTNAGKSKAEGLKRKYLYAGNAEYRNLQQPF